MQITNFGAHRDEQENRSLRKGNVPVVDESSTALNAKSRDVKTELYNDFKYMSS